VFPSRPCRGVDDKPIYAFFNTTHVITSYMFVALIAAHVLAAVRHLLLRDGIFSRMWPQRTGK
jgi:cytochrome b561